MTFTSILAFSARGVRSKQLTRRAFWADPTIHYLGQVAVESREGSEEPTIDQVRILAGPDRRPAQGENVEFFCLKSTSGPKYQSVELSEALAIMRRRRRIARCRP